MKLNSEHIVEIRKRFSTIETVEELADLLSWIYAVKFPKRSEKTNVIFEAKHLNYYAFTPKNRYKLFSIAKKSGGTRPISSPRYKLKTIQKCINEILNAIFIPHFRATGFVPGRSIVDNAKLHIGKQFVFNTDLKDFFPSTEFRRIKTVLTLEPFNLIDESERNNVNLKRKVSDQKGRGYLSYLIANLCCEKGVLPQGSPTSPTLTNVVCQRLDKKLYKFSKTINATYSRYADDITFSCNKPVFDEKFKKELNEIVEVKEKFKINIEKERIQSGGERQSVTGIIVNRKSNVDRLFTKDIRFWLMCWDKFGSGETQQKFLLQFPEKKGFLRYGGNTPQFYNYLNGKILFMGMVRGSNDEMYVRFKGEFDRLFLQNNLRSNLSRIREMESSLSELSESNLSALLDIWQADGIEAAIKNYS